MKLYLYANERLEVQGTGGFSLALKSPDGTDIVTFVVDERGRVTDIMGPPSRNRVLLSSVTQSGVIHHVCGHKERDFFNTKCHDCLVHERSQKGEP